MRADYSSLVASLIRDDGKILSPEQLDGNLTLAVQRYSTDSPQRVVVDLPENNSQASTNVLALPVGWQSNFSRVMQIEYPVGNFPSDILDAEDYQLYQSPSGWQIRFAYDISPPARLTYSIAHVLSDVADTIAPARREAVACWAAALGCEMLASWYANAGDSTLQADRVDRQNQSKDYTARANALRKRYLNELGLDDKRNVPAGAVVNLNLKDSLGRDRFTHPNRFR